MDCLKSSSRFNQDYFNLNDVKAAPSPCQVGMRATTPTALKGQRSSLILPAWPWNPSDFETPYNCAKLEK